MSKTFVISDLHGRADLLKEAVSRITLSSPSGGTIIFTGDYCDRGFESAEVYDILMRGPQDELWTWIPLLGNHDDFLYRACTYGHNITLWLMNGGATTLFSYGQEYGDIANPGMVPFEVSQWVGKLPWYYEDKHRVYVHAALRKGVPLVDQQLDDLIWQRYEPDGVYMLEHSVKEPGWAPDGKHLVHGHQFYEDGPLLLPTRTDLDTNAWATGRLVVGVFDDDTPGGPVSTITIQGPTINEFIAAHPKLTKMVRGTDA
jgi:serine/threonine protein phosphatase 1